MEIHAFELFIAVINYALLLIIPIAIVLYLVKKHNNDKKTLAILEELEEKIDSLSK